MQNLAKSTLFTCITGLLECNLACKSDERRAVEFDSPQVMQCHEYDSHKNCYRDIQDTLMHGGCGKQTIYYNSKLHTKQRIRHPAEEKMKSGTLHI